MSSPWRDLYARLAGNPDFLRLREEAGPIRERIEALTKRLKDASVVDPVEIATVKNELLGIEYVFETVCAKVPEPQPQEPRFALIRRTARAWKDSLLLPRPLG